MGISITFSSKYQSNINCAGSLLHPFRQRLHKQRKSGTGCLHQINDHLWEGKYSPRGADGKRISRNVYAKTREECEEKLAVMIEEMKREIAVEKEKLNNKQTAG